MKFNSFLLALQGVLGHGYGKYQPVPKRVLGVKRAIAVAAGEDHTLVLQAAFVPPLPLADLVFPVTADILQPPRRVAGMCSTGHHRCHSHDLDQCDSSDEGVSECDDDDSSSSEDGQPSRMRMKPLEPCPKADCATEEMGQRGDGESIVADCSGADSDRGVIDRNDSEKEDDTKRDAIKGEAASPGGKRIQEQMDTKSPDLMGSREFVYSVPSLRDLCQRELAKQVSLRSVVPLLANAEAFNCERLSDFCSEFIQR